MKYPVAKPDFTGNERKYVNDAVASGWASSVGPYVERFERKFAGWIGARHAVACSSGTAALTLALRAIGVGPGDEVIVPEFTMIASAWAVTYTGARPVFVDCGDDLNIDVSKIEAAITPRTKAIMPVHIYGRMAGVKAISDIAEKHGLLVVEDACEAHGAWAEDNDGEMTWNRPAGTWGIAGCFSLFGNKIVTAGEGGVVVTDDDDVARELRYLRAMAFEPSHTFLHRKIGYNFRMTNVQAAIALAQMESVDGFLEKREKIASWYDERIGQWTIPRPEGSVLWMYDVVVDSDKVEGVMARLAEDGIETRMFFKPMSMQPMYEAEWADLKATLYSKSGFYLPANTQLTHKDVDYICEKFLKAVSS